MAKYTILIVEDEPAIRDMLRMALEVESFECLEASTIQEGYTAVVDHKPDVLLLDWMLPGGSGIELLRRLKRENLTQDLPIIMLTAKTSEANIVQGLEEGADDYITKPFAPRELLARINALLRRSTAGGDQFVLEAGALRLDVAGHRVFVDDAAIDMGPTEFKLLKFFMSHPERAYSRSQLLDHVWGANVYVEERTVDVHIRRLRKALNTPANDCGKLIETVRGTGYRFTRGL